MSKTMTNDWATSVMKRPICVRTNTNKYLTTVGEDLCDVLLGSLRTAQERHQMRNHSGVLEKLQKILLYFKDVNKYM